MSTPYHSGGFAAAAALTGPRCPARFPTAQQLEKRARCAVRPPFRNAKLTPLAPNCCARAAACGGRRGIAERVKRVATGWGAGVTIAVDSLISRKVVFELCQAFFELKAPTRLRLRGETLSGTWRGADDRQGRHRAGRRLRTGSIASTSSPGIQVKTLGEPPSCSPVAPRHPLPKRPEPLSDRRNRAQHRVVAVWRIQPARHGLSVNLLAGRDVFTVPSMQAKLDAHLRGLGCGFLPLLAQPAMSMPAELIAKTVQQRALRVAHQLRLAQPAARGRKGHALDMVAAGLDSPDATGA